MAQLVERLLLNPEVHSSNPVIGKILYWTFTVNCIQKTKIKKRRPGMAHKHFCTFLFMTFAPGNMRLNFKSVFAKTRSGRRGMRKHSTISDFLIPPNFPVFAFLSTEIRSWQLPLIDFKCWKLLQNLNEKINKGSARIVSYHFLGNRILINVQAVNIA